MLRKVLPLMFLIVASAMAHAEKVSGFVSGSPSGKTFVLGAKGGPYKVDTSKARITLNGKFFALAKLTGGSQVTVEGTKTGKNIAAATVVIGNLKGAPKAKPTVSTSAAPKKPTTAGKTKGAGH